MNKEINPRQPIKQIEEEVLSYWQKNKIYEKVKKAGEKKPYYSFYDGPPFANGLPHQGHLLVSVIKDSVLRYWSMWGKKISRRVGWDCHGLPVENLIEQELGLKSKKDIEKIGVEKFNNACRASVFRYAKEWVKTLTRLGRWADYDKAYATMDNKYIESVWWVFKKIWDAGLIYESFRVTPYCPRCGTPLSNFEVGQGYRDITEPSVYLKFALKGEDETYFLVWTTTPWTLPANLALAVGKDFDYVKVEYKGENLILAKERLKVLPEAKIIEEFKGKNLVNKEYVPLFNVFNPEPLVPQKSGTRVQGKKNSQNNFFRVYPANFVSIKDGTGIVHMAPHFGEDDFNLFKENNIAIPKLITVNEAGEIIKGHNIPGQGKKAKEGDNDIKSDLKKRNFLFKEENITHSYPHCWRCDEPLLYYPIKSWYVKVTDIKDLLVKNNEKINWSPSHLKHGRFGKWLQDARDWAISRNRFWGAPIPVWVCKNEKKKNCKNKKAVGSTRELEKLSGKKAPKDLHKPYIDKVELKCDCGSKMKRVPYVFDCWFESGSMPWASWHYPFENKKMVEENFPADFIAEAIDQTRGWFYTLHVLASALTKKDIGLGKGKPAFKNVISNGLVLAENGKKLSKKLENYTEPEELMDKFGADSFRLFLLTGASLGENYLFDDKAVQDVFRNTILRLLNSYSFFLTYAKIHNFKPGKPEPKNIFDKWIVSELNILIKEINENMEKYELVKAARLIPEFVDNLSNWYIRRSRLRLKHGDTNFLNSFYYVLIELSKILSPFTPFLAEKFYLALGGKKDSVHLEEFPASEEKMINEKLSSDMLKIRWFVSEVHASRKKVQIKVRKSLSLEVKKETEIHKLLTSYDISSLLLSEVEQELNARIDFKEELSKGKNYLYDTCKIFALNTEVTEESEQEDLLREITRQINDIRKKIGCQVDDEKRLKIFIGPASKNLKKFFKNKDLYTKLVGELSPYTEIILVAIKESEGDYLVEIEGEKINFVIK